MYDSDFLNPDPEAEKIQDYLKETFGSRNNLLRLLISKSSGFKKIDQENFYMRFDFRLADQEFRMPLDARIKEALSTEKRIESLGIHMCKFLGGTYKDYVANFLDFAKYRSIGNQYLDLEDPTQIINQPVIVLFPKPEPGRDNEKQRYIRIDRNELNEFIDYIKRGPLSGSDDFEVELSEVEKMASNVRIAEEDRRVIYDLKYINGFLNILETFVKKK